MADNSLKIDDDYCIEMGDYYVKMGDALEDVLRKYVNILESIRSDAWIKGHGARGLDTYIAEANRLTGKISNLASTASGHARSFIASVDNADKFLY